MKTPFVLLLITALPLIGCANLIQTASISEAYKHFELQQYERTLQLITQAENAEQLPPETRAELAYLKAKTYESLGESEVAHTLYEYLAQQHSSSQYGYLAVARLNAS